MYLIIQDDLMQGSVVALDTSFLAVITMPLQQESYSAEMLPNFFYYLIYKRLGKFENICKNCKEDQLMPAT